MLESAAVMQDRGQSMTESDTASQKQKAQTKASEIPEEEKEVKAEEEEGKEKMFPEDLMEMEGSREKVVPGAGAKGRNGGKKEEEEPQQKPKEMEAFVRKALPNEFWLRSK